MTTNATTAPTSAADAADSATPTGPGPAANGVADTVLGPDFGPVVGPIVDEVGRVLAAHLPVIAVTVAVLTAAGIGLVEWLGHRRHRHERAGAQRVRIRPGPRVDPAGAVVFWQHLLGLLPHRWHRRRAGHVVFEYTFTEHGLDISVWLPASVPAGLVAAAARSAWPESGHLLVTVRR